MKRRIPLDKTDHPHSSYKRAHSDGGCVSVGRQSMLLPQNSQEPVHPDPECVSMKSDQSMPLPQNFSREPTHPDPECVSMKSDHSMALPRNFSCEPTHPDPDRLNVDEADDQSMCRIAEPVSYSGHSISKLTDDEVLKRVKQKHKASLKRRFENISEGARRTGAETLLSNIYTELYITEGQSEGVNKEHEVWQLESAFRSQTSDDIQINCNDIFKPLPGHEKHIRTVMTKGVAGIGKTVSVQKFITDWTEEVANQNIDFIFPLPFRELNLIKNDQYSLHRLLLDFHPELKELKEGEEYKDCQILFIFDGLDESRFLMDYKQNTVSDVQQPSSVDVLMTSLIQGSLLPSALIWISSRPAAASQVPAQSIDQFTEVRGFSDPQKEEYFRKRISDVSLASRIISHIKVCRSLHIMCHIPVFCWITATVLQQMLIGKLIKDSPETETLVKDIPKTMTGFVHFLLIQTTRKDQKYQGTSGAHKEGPLSQGRTILKLAELAFRNLKNGNLMFYEEDLRECGIDVTEASVYSGMCTEIFKEESVFRHRKVYCFVHLSIQEFLAAVHVFYTYVIEATDPPKSLFKEHHATILGYSMSRLCVAHEILSNLLIMAVDEALDSKNGHLDLFLRFLMGISLERNHRLLNDLWDITHSSDPQNRKYRPRDITHSSDPQNRKYSPRDITHKLQYITRQLQYITYSLRDLPDSLEDITDSQEDITHNREQKVMTYKLWGITHRLQDLKHRLQYITDSLQELTDSLEDITHNRAQQDMTYKLRGITHRQQDLKHRLQGITDSLRDVTDSQEDLTDSLEDITHNREQQDMPYKLRGITLRLQDLKYGLQGIAHNFNLQGNIHSLQHIIHTLLDFTRNQGVQDLETSVSISKICKYFKGLNRGDLSPERCINLFHCLFEVNDYSMHDEIQKYLESPKQTQYGLSPAHCSALAHMLLMSEEVLDEFDLKKYRTSDVGRRRLLPAMRRFRTARLANCELRDKSCGIVAGVLQSPNHLIELDLSHNDLGDSGVQLLSAGLSSPQCRMQTLRLSKCNISAKGYVCLALTLMLNPSCVKELDVSNNHPGESAEKLLSAMLERPQRQVNTIQFSNCELVDKSCEIVAAVLQSPNSITELDLSHNDLGDAGVQLLSAGLSSTHCKLRTLRLADCRVTENSITAVASMLQLPNSLLELDLSHNDLGDSGAQLLSVGLSSPQCKLKTLRLAGCGMTKKSCEIVAAILQSPNSLIELDLSLNGLGDSGVQLCSTGLCSIHCKVQTLTLAGCGVTKKSCEIMVSILQSPDSLIELDLSHNELRGSGVETLSAGLSDPHCSLQRLRLSACAIPEEGCVYLASALASDSSHLKELDLSYSHPGESGLQLLFALFEDPGCELEILKLVGCRVTEKSCKIVASVLPSLNSLLELDLSTNDLGDSGVQSLMQAISGPCSKLQTLRLACCGLTEKSCEMMASMFQSENSLVELDLSHNDFGDSGVQFLIAGLSNHHCKLLILRLSGCLISEKGCSLLASALALNHSPLKELDLSYNHPGELGLTQLSARLKDPKCKLETLNTDHCAEIRLRADVRRYGCDLTLDPLTANRFLLLSDSNRQVKRISDVQTGSDKSQTFGSLPQELFPIAPTANSFLLFSNSNWNVTHMSDAQTCSDGPQRFDSLPQVLCKEGLVGRFYWEAEWTGTMASIAVAYKSIKRKGESTTLGCDDKSWSLDCTDKRYSAKHKNMSTNIYRRSCSRRVGVHLDWLAGTLSFYRVDSDTLTHLHTFQSTFTEPLYPVFWLWFDSSVSLCQIT